MLGGPEVLEQAGVVFVMGNPEFAGFVQSMGSPGHLYASLEQMGENLAPCLALTFDEVAPGEWLASSASDDGYEPFPEYCRYCSGMLASGTLPFGLPAAEVVEETCVFRGDDVCRYRIRCERRTGPTTRAACLEHRIRMLDGPPGALQETVADLVSGGRPRGGAGADRRTIVRAAGAGAPASCWPSSPPRR